MLMVAQRYRWIFIDREAGEIMRLVASVCLSVYIYVYVCVCISELSCLILKKHHKVVISGSIQNGWVFKMLAVLTGCAIALDHAFNF